MSKAHSILIVEDELITASSIQELLMEEDFAVMGIAKDAATALRLCAKAEVPPSIVICDINIKGNVKGTDLAGHLKKLYGCEIIFLTAYTDNHSLKAAFGQDPVMYIVKPYTDTQLLVALDMAFHQLFRSNEKAASKNGPLVLTDREKEIAQLVARGHSSKQVARQLSISIETVKTHRRRMLQKNNITSFSHLVYLMNG